MKEEAPNKKLPPKIMGGNANLSSTPTKTSNDEILTTLLRMNNFDSISSIKDESLDIDLSACVTISADSAMMINGNSLSTTDFWRVLDESAQNSQLDITLSSDEATNPATRTTPKSDAATAYDFTNEEVLNIKKEVTPNTFSGTFLRPETPPPGTIITFSPLKKLGKSTVVSEKTPTKKARKTKLPQANVVNVSCETKKSKAIQFIKEEPPEQLLIDALDNAATSPIAHNHHAENGMSTARMNSSPPKFKIFMLPTKNNNINNNNNNNNNNINPVNDETVTKSNEEVVSKAAPSVVEEKLYKCVDCVDLLLKGDAERRTHELAGHRVLFKCNLCVRDFEQEAAFKKHMKTHRAVETRKDAWKKCPDCGKCLKLGSMWMHRKIHSENKKYSCDICGQKFVQKINLTHHSRVHTAEKPYECPECQKRFQERSHLYRHQKYHAQIRQYRCEKCGKMYKTERCLKVHNLVHLEQRPFACTVCDKSFISNSKLKQHSNIHTGERPFKCNYCPRDFTNFPNWLKHTRRRHKVDHKTGEQLENIPSYCSKKSNKPAQSKKINTTTTGVTTTTTTTTTTTITNGNKINVSLPQAVTVTVTATPTITSRAVAMPTNGVTNKTTTVVTKAPVKRQKKKIITENDTQQQQTQTPQQQQQQKTTTNIDNNDNKNFIINGNNLKLVGKQTNLISTTVTTTTTTPTTTNINIIKSTKVKRERKQATPKQVQKSMQPPPTPTATLGGTTTTTISGQLILPNNSKVTMLSNTSPISQIKREIVESVRPLSQITDNSIEKSNASIMSSFNDLHCLSITSAEELIMEQALEMEESGLFDAPRNSDIPTDIGGTDNAVSATETAAAFHFKVKNEIDTEVDVHGIKQEEFLSLKDSHKHVICSSLESSPYSSPASIELCSVNAPTISTTNDVCSSSSNNLGSNSPIYYMPTNFQLHHSGLTGNLTVLSNSNGIDGSRNKIQLNDTSVTLVSTDQQQQQQSQQQQQMIHLPTQVLINQLYMPAFNGSNGMLLPLNNNQMLPSVDTLLFSAAAAASRVSPTISVNTNATTTAKFHRPKGVTPQSRT